MCSISLVSKRGEQGSLYLLLKQGLATLGPCPDDYLKVFTRDKAWGFTLFLLLLPCWKANRLIVYS